MIRNHLEGLNQFQAMWANWHYVTHAAVFGLYVLGDNLESNPNHEQEMQELEFYIYSIPIYEELARDADVVLWIFLKVVATTT